MPIVTLRVPDVNRKRDTRPQKSWYCQEGTFQHWAKVIKPVRDKCYRTVTVYRYPCCHCQRTFRQYLAGINRADQSERMLKFAAIFWVLGMSFRGTC